MSEPLHSDESQQRFVRLLAKHEPEIRGFIRASLPSAADVAEVVQNVSLVAWKKFSDLENPEDFGRWACVIARFEILKYRRGIARDRLVLDQDLVEKMCEEGESEMDRQAGRIQWLEHCLQKLPRDRRNLLLQAYHPRNSMKDVAAREGKKPNALYQILSRLRRELGDCIEREKMHANRKTGQI